MYQKRFNNGRSGNRFGDGNRNYGGNRPRRQGFRIKNFDPSNIVQRAVTDAPKVEEYVAKNKFGDFAISEKMKANIAHFGYTTPTPIQDAAIPELINGRDLIGIARTGTGKTAAFLIPLIEKVVKNRNEKVLILAPTRELAVQIRDEFNKFSRDMNLYSALCIGGVSIYGQVKTLYKNPQFVIGTPGRLKDLENQRKLNFGSFKNIVLDEVDHMLDMGFIIDVDYIVSKLPQDRQSLFFSATIPPKIEGIMRKLLHDPIKIEIASNAPTTNVEQEIVRTNGKDKVELLHDMLIQKDFTKVLIFGRTKFGVEKLSKELAFRGFKVASIHGNKSQSQRQRAITDFKSNYIQVLLATDIASRGLDINDVSHVINYELPESYEDYIHRIGRTGRAGKKGKAITFTN